MANHFVKGLSIVVPSYNRKNQLLRLLESIQCDSLEELYEIVIIDNCSEYDIYEVLKPFNYNKIRVVRNPFNVRMGTNMMNTFYHCKTSWMWVVSDDDIVCKGALREVLLDIKMNDEVSMLKYSTEGTGSIGQEKENRVKGLQEFITYYHDEPVIRRGNLVFLSNGVYNVNKLLPYLGRGFEFSYTYIPCLIPVLFALNEGGEVQFKEKKIVKYINPGDGFWSFKTVGLGLSTISHLPFNLNKADRKKFFNTLMPINFVNLFLFLIEEKDDRNSSVYSIIYNNIYRFYLTPLSKFKYYILASCLKFPKVILPLIHSLKKLKNKNV